VPYRPPDDAGLSWVRINDDKHQYGNIGEAITGDPRIYGRVYIGTNGRGIIYGDRQSSASPSISTSPSASASSSASASASPSRSASSSASPSRSATSSASPSRSPSASASSSAPGSCKVAYAIAGQWPGGFQGAVHITNTGSTAINGWTLTWTFPSGQVITQMWGGVPSQTGAAVSVANVNYTATLSANGGSQDIGFLANAGSSNAVPTSFKLNGVACAIG